MQDGAVLGGVDLLAGEHRVDARAQAARLGEFEQQAQRFLVEQLPREIEQQVELAA